MGNAMTGLRERLESAAQACECYSPDQCATMIDGIGWIAMRHLLREAAAALAEGDGAVGYLNISEASEGDGWQDCVTMTAAGRALPVGRHAIYTSPPAASVDVDGQVAKLQAFKDYVHQRLDEAGVPTDPPSPHREAGCRVGGRLDWLIDSAGGANGITGSVSPQMRDANACTPQPAVGDGAVADALTAALAQQEPRHD